MTTDFTVEANLRSTTGSAHARRSRRDLGIVPAIIYGGTTEPVSIEVDNKKVSYSLHQEGFSKHILDITYGDKTEKVILKAIQKHPSRDELIHLDFQRVSAEQKIIMMVPIQLENADASIGIKAGGIVSQQITEVEISCFPDNLPEKLVLDIAHLENDSSLHLTDLLLPTGVELTIDVSNEDHNQPVVSIQTPKANKEDLEADTAEQTDAESEEKTGDKAKAEGKSE